MFSSLIRRSVPVLFIATTTLVASTTTTPSTTCDKDFKMPHRVLGKTGMAVSVLSFGFWATFGAKDDLQKQEGLERAKDCLRTAREHGVNLFDNAETYGEPRGEAETIMGEAIQQLVAENPTLWRRSDIIITTKIFWGGEGVNEKGLSRKHIDEGVDACLQRLQVKYVDVLFCHRPDPYTPTEMIVRAMTDAVRSGKTKSWGTSEWSAQQITEAVWIARMYGLEPPLVEQPQYHMFHRERFESEYFPIFHDEYKIGTTIWSPLASGLLTGKYNDEIPEGSRLAGANAAWLKPMLDKWRKEGKIDKVRLLSKFAQEKLGCSVSQLALAWCIKNKNVSTVLLGATNSQQLKENLGSIEVARRLTAEDMKAIEEILGNKPEGYIGYGNVAAFRTIDTI